MAWMYRTNGGSGEGMYEIAVDGVAEAVHHSRSDQQRHEEVKVLRPKARTPGRHLIRHAFGLTPIFAGR